MGFDGNPSKSHLNPCKHWVLSGRSVGARTPDPLIKSQLLYQLSYTSMMTGAKAGPVQKKWSERRDSNPRQSPWQGDTLPTELRSRKKT